MRKTMRFTMFPGPWAQKSTRFTIRYQSAAARWQAASDAGALLRYLGWRKTNKASKNPSAIAVRGKKVFRSSREWYHNSGQSLNFRMSITHMGNLQGLSAMEVLCNSSHTYSKWQLLKHLFKMATLQNGNSSNRPLGLLGLLRYLRLKSVDYPKL